ncbi:Bifunctional 2-C-methyl-D-erythritol 4-phosphatecytidylyltransferase/2-C-methyl-D-erythritol 2,4-cyclodiphosphate synthase [Candidatus Erwinia haradaeae]|uniref:Bifunctional enzyme IspD/IspF n=2 Tax=Candidatus Erwinia haradaeae TaxID=1922217 RepID=A0A451D4Q9_9GAMM|nr:Bifunctional 2-C-methyl-D-erythritol 4-phosphatecytidylyltransferase/2-C-methyl-D-erythritol 2,4-cyclodiphosphate synthase [Candidatus Erwinia haradaeae]
MGNNTSLMDVIAIVPAAGIGSRMQSKRPKQYLIVAGKTILEHTLNVLLQNIEIKKIIVALHPEDVYFNHLSVAHNLRITTVTGGKWRANSVLAALQAAPPVQWVLIHDAARPCLRSEDLERILRLTLSSKIGGILAIPVRDTIKQAGDGNNQIHASIQRKSLWHALTPQLFPLKLLLNCLQRVIDLGKNITDEASALEFCGYQPELIKGHSDNVKITYPEDLALAEAYLSTKVDLSGHIMRIGHGFDIHAFGGIRPLILCGVLIPNSQGLLAHSDGDVALHALTDALIGAAALGDIGTLFSESNPLYAGIDSRFLLREVFSRVTEKNYQIGNVDITIIAQIPKIIPYITQMRINISEDLCINQDSVNIKATTTEKLGCIGRKEGIACEAVLLLKKS